MLNEADTRAKLIDPKLHAAGWGEERIHREYPISAGRVFLVGDEHRRKPPKKADYLLRYMPAMPMAVVEAKDESHAPAHGIPQAKEYAERLGVLFAYASNGRGIEEFDFTTNRPTSLGAFPTPEDLFERWSAAQAPPAAGRKAAAPPSGDFGNPLFYPFHTVPGGKILRAYQEIAIRRAVEAVVLGDHKILLTMATGTGKTFVAFQIAWKLVKSGLHRRVLFLADRNILRDQAYNNFGPFGDARAIIEESKAPKTRDIYFGIYQAMYSQVGTKRLFQDYPRDFFNLIIIDECHRSGFGTWRAILDHFSPAVQLGMTATPKRDDNIDTYAYFGDPVYTYSLGQGIDDGYLATYKVHKVRTNIDRDGLTLEDARSQGAEIFVPEEAEPRDLYVTEQFEREIVLPDRTARMCEHLAGLLRTFGPMEKTMVFCVNTEHAGLVAKELQNHFAHLAHSNYAVRIIGEEQSDLEAFRDSDKLTPVVATTVDLLTTGVDVPSCRNIVFMRPIGSRVVFKQIIGRGSRIDEARGKYWFRIIDYTGASRLFDDWDRPPSPPPKPRPEGPRDRYLQGLVLDTETGAPVSGALVTLLIGPNEQVQVRTCGDGRFSFEGLPDGHVTLIVTCDGYRRRQLAVETMEGQEESLALELKPVKASSGEKIRVQGLTVEIAEETYLELETTGERLSIREYIDYTKGVVLSLAPTEAALRRVWQDPDRRRGFVDDLAQKGVHPEILSDLVERPDADTFDTIGSIAYGTPLRTREERAKALANLEQDFLQAYGPDAREVLVALLDKYRFGGVEELAKPEVFSIPPFDRMGHAPGVARIFGGPDRLREALRQLQAKLYKLEEAA